MMYSKLTKEVKFFLCEIKCLNLSLDFFLLPWNEEKEKMESIPNWNFEEYSIKFKEIEFWFGYIAHLFKKLALEIPKIEDVLLPTVGSHPVFIIKRKDNQKVVLKFFADIYGDGEETYQVELDRYSTFGGKQSIYIQFF